MFANGAEGVGLFRTEMLYMDLLQRAGRARGYPSLPAGATGSGRQADYLPHNGHRRR
ncbi:putative PEP-binding protein [Escherichia coli]